MMLKRFRLPYLNSQQDGYVMLLAIIMAITLFISLGGVISLTLVSLNSAKRSIYDLSSLYTAEAGIDNAVFQLNANQSYTGTNTSCPLSASGENPVTLFSNTNQGKGTYENCVTAGSIPNEYVVYSEGKVYRSTTDSSPISTREVRAVIEGSPAGSYAVQTGPGGLIMSNSATINNGPISVGGYLTLSNSATIGSVTSPLTVNIADERCPKSADNTYPRLCANGEYDNPITINSPSNHIYGTVNANNQTNNYSTQMTDPGLQATSGVTAPTLPTYDRSAQKSDVSNYMDGSDASCSGSTVQTWPANLKISGDVTLGNNCVTYVSGNVWITGSLSMSQKAIIKPKSGLATQPVIMIDGSSGMTLSNQSYVADNSNSTGIEFITYYCGSGCDPDSTVTGAALAASQTINTITLGQQSNAPGSVFYAYWSEITVNEGGTLGAVLGQTINLAQSGSISFISTVSTGNYVFDVRYYQVLN
jgi:hypothetical protein